MGFHFSGSDAMRIALVRPGKIPIPPRGWGAVEAVVHEVSVRLKQRGHDVLVVSGRDADRIVHQVNEFAPDFVHLHLDQYHRILQRFDCPNKAITAHYPFLEQVTPQDSYAKETLAPVVAARDVHIFALSEAAASAYVRFGVAPERVRVAPNGVDVQAFRFSASPRLPDRSICLGRINPRKRQKLLQSYACDIDFVGPVKRRRKRWFRFWKKKGFDAEAPDYLGEWTREEVRERLTDYPNMVLLSKAEAHSLVCMESLAAGLGLVVSERATAYLDLSKSFIDVIPERKVADRDYVCAAVRANRLKSIEMREEIRDYARQFSWESVLDRYCAAVTEICANQASNRARELRAG